MKRRIKILAAKHIDKDKWDHCVSHNDNGLIYSSVIYLNSMSQNWHGLVVDDYAAVMALPWKKKLKSIRYAYTPPFIQQLGLIGDTTDIDLRRVLKLIYRFVSYADFNFNFSNTGIQQLVPVIPRTDFTIDLSAGYDLIKSNYKSNLKENIRKASNESFTYSHGDLNDGINMYHTLYKGRIKHVHEKDYKHFLKLCEVLLKKEQCFVRVARDRQNEILAIGIFLKDSKRIYNIMNTTTQQGRDKEANHFLLNQVIHEFAGQPLLFDFEGSELPGVREFYENFGPVNHPYFHYHYNGYTWPLKMLSE
jgi:hypothetical protein